MNSRRPFWIGCVGALLAEAALIYESGRTGLHLIPFTGIVFIPILLLVYVGVCRLVSRVVARPRVALGLRVAFWLVIVGGTMVQGYVSGTPKAMFEKLGMKPMPASVRNFEWQGGAGIDGYFLYTFKADSDDTKRLIQHLHLEMEMDVSIQRDISNKFLWLSKPSEKLESPVIYRRTNPWRVELMTDAAHHKVYVFW